MQLAISFDADAFSLKGRNICLSGTIWAPPMPAGLSTAWWHLHSVESILLAAALFAAIVRVVGRSPEMNDLTRSDAH